MAETLSQRKRGNRVIENALFVTDSSEGEILVGDRLRDIRSRLGLSMRALATLSNLNVNTLSLIENGRTSPSVSTLQQLAQSLHVPITAFFETDHGEMEVVFQKNGARPHATFTYGLMEDLGAGMPRFGAEPLIVTLNPGADSGRTPIVHTGREFVYCVEGQITYTIDAKTYILEPGDSLLFEAYLPHTWRNPGTLVARALLVLCPLDERDNPTARHFG